MQNYTRFRDIPQFTRAASYQVNVGWDFVEHTLEHWNENNMLELDPDFQRAHVWTQEKQESYVEFILRGGHSSKLIQFNCSSWMKGFDTPVELVDGKQRLEAARKFMRNELVVFGNCRFSDFTDRLRITTADFIFCVNDLSTRAEVLQWYLDLNAGGVVHTDEEIEKVRRLLKKEKRI